MQSVRRHGGTGEITIFCGKNGGDALGLQLPLSDIKQRTDDCTYHTLQESTAPDAEYPLLLCPPPVKIENGSDAILDDGIFCAKGCEVVGAQQMLPSRINSL